MTPKRFLSVRFDPSYYYDIDMDIDELCLKLAEKWSAAGLNAVYIKVYDPIYGAVYRSKHSFNIETDYGRMDFLKHFIKACKKEGIQIYAWIPAFQHKHLWEAHPDWRVKLHDGSDYQPTDESYFLCVRNPDFRKWWLDFLNEILKRYKDLDGLDIGEPIVSWKSEHGCYCNICQAEYKNNPTWDKSLIRSQPLTRLLNQSTHLVHEFGGKMSLTTIATPNSSGNIFSPAEQRRITGFDLEGIITSKDVPDILNVELIWQQWADLYGDSNTFSPEWTKPAVRQILQDVGSRTQLVAHLELTSFGQFQITDDQFLKSIRYAFDGGTQGIDFYDAFQADGRNIWPRLKETTDYIPLKRIALFYDPDAENDARQLEVLLRHFHSQTTLMPLADNFDPVNINEKDYIFYIGESSQRNLPVWFIDSIRETRIPVFWIQYNLEQLGRNFLERLGIQFLADEEKGSFEIQYKDFGFAKLDSSMNRIHVADSSKCRVIATAVSSSDTLPYIVNAGSFWYAADLPTSYIIEGGRHIVFSDLLHDFLKEDHQDKHTALLRIEDVNPLSDPAQLRSVAKYLGSINIPFSVGLTPFYLDPSTNTVAALSDRPELVKALHFMISRGANIVLHGCTHQYRGQSTVDYEFWDGLNDRPIFHDSEEYIRERIERALDECFRNDIFPIAWETPHYAASLMDYKIINRHFSTAYERRQTMNQTGTDQLLPFFIPARDENPALIPENLGYVPLENASAAPHLENAKKNLALRDGYASHFFHPFVPLDVLKNLVSGIRKMGYHYGNIRALDNTVQTNSRVIKTQSGRYQLLSKDGIIKERYINIKGKTKQEIINADKVPDTFENEIQIPEGWMLTAETLPSEPSVSIQSQRRLLRKTSNFINRFWKAPELTPSNPVAIPLILVDPEAVDSLKIDQESFQNAFGAAGIDFQTVMVNTFLEIPESINLLVVPYAAARKLTEQQNLFILRAVSLGLNLILEQESDLSRRIGITSAGEAESVQEILDEYYPQVNIRWSRKGIYQPFDMDSDYISYYSMKESETPLVIGSNYGRGKFIYFGTLLDPETGLGYGRFPFFCDLIQRHLNLWPLIKNESIEIYFEPGDREDVSIEELVKVWKESGFRKIYVAGWHMYDQWTYDYERLIRLAHENAMLVYLWLELPHVNQKFWNDHPEWREKTATGEDAFIDWRRHMALTDESCRFEIYQILSRIIQNYDWDGINLAELYFESALGPERPDIFTPMHPSVRQSFSDQNGFDPIRLFDMSDQYYWAVNSKKWNLFESYRKNLVVFLHQEFLNFLHDQNKMHKNNLEIVLTVVDNIVAKYTGKGTGMETQRLIPLAEKFPFTLQIEDPRELWHLGPSRYEQLTETYQNLNVKNKMILDINIVPFRDWNLSLAPTQQPTGLEFLHLIRGAMYDSNRVALYSESSIYQVDLPWIAFTFGRQASEDLSSKRNWSVSSPHSNSLDLNPERHKDILVNGQLWPACYQGKVILPAGSFTIESVSPMETLKNTLKTNTRLVDLSGELISCQFLNRGIEVISRSAQIHYIIVNEKPKTVMVDGSHFEPEVYHGNAGYSLKLPSGHHKVTIITRSAGSFSLKNFGFITSLAIVFISIVAGTFLIFLYAKRFKRNRTGSM